MNRLIAPFTALTRSALQIRDKVVENFYSDTAVEGRGSRYDVELKGVSTVGTAYA